MDILQGTRHQVDNLHTLSASGMNLASVVGTNFVVLVNKQEEKLKTTLPLFVASETNLQNFLEACNRARVTLVILLKLWE